MRIIFLILTVFTAMGLQAEANKPGVEVFRYDGAPGYDVIYRIPAMTTVTAGSHEGRVVAIADYRYSGVDIGAGRIDLHSSYSDDGGTTWTGPIIPVDSIGNTVTQGRGDDSLDCAYGDAALVCDRETGRIMMVAATGDTNFFRCKRERPMGCYLWYSDDGATSWSHPRDITEKILTLMDNEPDLGGADSFFFGSGQLIQSNMVKAGSHYRVYGALSTHSGGYNTTRNWVVYTDDFGDSWHLLGDSVAVKKKGDEPKVVELNDGRILLAGRRSRGNRQFAIFSYTDTISGKGKWSEPLESDLGTGIKLNACNGDVMIVDAGVKYGRVLLQSFVNSPRREKVSIAWKRLGTDDSILTLDDLHHWDGIYEVTDLPSAYSTMTLLPDGRVGILYEESRWGVDYSIIFNAIPLPTIIGE